MLPRELDLAARFEVSRGVARDAIQALRERQVVSVRHGSGARLLPMADWDLLDVEVLAVLSAAPDHHDLRAEVLEALRTLEPPAAARAAKRLPTEAAERLQAALDRMGAQTGIAGYVLDDPRVQAQADFHDALMAAGGNRPLRRVAKPLHTGLAVMVHTRLGPRQRTRVIAEHRAVLAAVRSASPKAARRAVDDLLASLVGLLAR